MQSNNPLRVDFKNIHSNISEIKATLDSTFFEGLEQDEIVGGDVMVELSIRRSAGDVYLLDLEAKGTVSVECDRCLGLLAMPVDVSNTLKLKESDDDSSIVNDELIMLTYEASGIYDLSWLVYESIELSLPLLRIHADGECDSEMINKLQSYMARQDNEDNINN